MLYVQNQAEANCAGDVANDYQPEEDCNICHEKSVQRQIDPPPPKRVDTCLTRVNSMHLKNKMLFTFSDAIFIAN